jgi:hypothetical protein
VATLQEMLQERTDKLDKRVEQLREESEFLREVSNLYLRVEQLEERNRELRDAICEVLFTPGALLQAGEPTVECSLPARVASKAREILEKCKQD